MSGIVDKYLNPSFQADKFRIEFRIPKGKVFGSNVKLCKIGFKSTDSADNIQYNPQLGALGLIKSIILQDKGVEIDSCKSCSGLIAFKNLLGRPSDLYGRAQETSDSAGLDMMSKFTANGTLEAQRITTRVETQFLGSGENDGADAYVPLSYFLPSLNALQSLDTSLMDDLRLVIELESSAVKTLRVTNKNFSNINAVLKLQEVEDPKLKAEMSAKSGVVSWETYEHDRFSLGDNTTAENTLQTQETSVRLNGLRNKYVTRILLQKVLATNNADIVNNNKVLAGVSGSLANLCERVQIRVNGADKFAENGVGGDTTLNGAKSMEVVAVTQDAWGEYSLGPYGAEYGKGPGAYDADFNNWDIDDLISVSTAQKRSYVGCKVDDFCQDFQVIYSRGTIAGEVNAGANHLGNSSFTNLAQTVNVYYGTLRSLVVKDGKYAVVYKMSV